MADQIRTAGVTPADVDRIKALAAEYRADATDASMVLATLAGVRSRTVLDVTSIVVDALTGLAKMRVEQAADFDVQVQACAGAGIVGAAP